MSTHTKALWAVIIGNSIFGFSFLFSKVALEIAIPSVMLAIRFTTAFVVLNLIVLLGVSIKKKNGEKLISFSLKGKPIKLVILLAFLQPVVYFFAESYGITYTSSAFAGTIIAVIPLAGIVFDVVIMHVKVTKKQILCSFGSVVGVIITTLGAENMKSSVLGLFLLLIAVVAGALYYVVSQKAGAYFSALERTYVMFGVGSFVYVIFALIQCRGAYDEMILPALASADFWGCMMYLGVVSSVGAFMILNYGTTYVSVSEGSIFANLTTVISIVAGLVIVHESFTIWQIIGAVVIIGSVYISTIKK